MHSHRPSQQASSFPFQPEYVSVRTLHFPYWKASWPMGSSWFDQLLHRSLGMVSAFRLGSFGLWAAHYSFGASLPRKDPSSTSAECLLGSASSVAIPRY